MPSFRVVQPWGRDKARQSALISEHVTAADAFAEIDRLAAQMARTGAPTDVIELVVVNEGSELVRRRDAH